MQAQSKVFACGKVMALGALYDTIERLKWKLLSANSDAGILMIAERKTGMTFLIRVCSELDEQVEVTLELASCAFNDKNSPDEYARSLFATLSQIIEDALTFKEGKGDRNNV